MVVKGLIALLFVSLLLTGCGEVTVFGHVVREGNKGTEVKPESTTTTPSQASASTPTATLSKVVTTVAPTESTTQTPVVTPTTANSNPGTVSQSAKATIAQPMNAVTLSIAPEVAGILTKDSRFNANALLNAIKLELQSRKLLNASDSSPSFTLEIYIDHYDLHANTNFVMFGSTPHTGTLAGNLLLRDEQGDTVPLSHLEAYSRISVPETGDPKNLLQPLYLEFSVAVANSLGGTHTRSGATRE